MIYFVGVENKPLVKVGRTIDIKKRMNSLSAGVPFSLQLLHTIEDHNDAVLEKQIHKFLKEHRVKGEWFGITRTKARDTARHFQQGLQFSSNPIIDGVLYLASRIEVVNGNLQTVTESCFFCGKKHLHGAIDSVSVNIEGLQSYGHRVAHCGASITREIHGRLLSNDKGYYLWIKDREGEAKRRQRLKSLARWIADPEYCYEDGALKTKSTS